MSTEQNHNMRAQTCFVLLMEFIFATVMLLNKGKVDEELVELEDVVPELVNKVSRTFLCLFVLIGLRTFKMIILCQEIDFTNSMLFMQLLGYVEMGFSVAMSIFAIDGITIMSTSEEYK